MDRLNFEEYKLVFHEIIVTSIPYDKEVNAKLRNVVEQEVVVEVYMPITNDLKMKHGTLKF